MKKEETMTSRERVTAAFNHVEPDRVPINYYANSSIDRKMKDHFGLKENDDEGLLQILGADFRAISPEYTGARLHSEVTGRMIDPQWGVHRIWVENDSGGYWDYCDFPLNNADAETMEKWPMPSADDFDYEGVSEQCRRYGNAAIYTGGGGLVDIINFSGMLCGMEKVLIDLISNDPGGLCLIDRRLEIQLEITRRTLEAANGRIDFLWIGEDLGTQNGQMISKDLFRRHIRPRHQKFVDLAKSFNIPVMIHSCGSSSWAFDDFIEMGINAVDTLQPEAKDMAPGYLKEKYGKKLMLHGAVSTAGPLASGSSEETRQDVMDILEVMMPGGGYCLAPTHLIQDNSPVENIAAMYETALKHGFY